MGYVYLIIAIIGEVVGTISLKNSNNLSELIPSMLIVLGYGIAFYFMMLSMRTIPVAITYSIWAGVGITAKVVWFETDPVNMSKSKDKTLFFIISER